MEPSAGSSATNTSDSSAVATSRLSTVPDSPESRYAALFLNRTDLALRWTVAGGRAHWYCSREKMTRPGLSGALHGVDCLGLYAVSQTGTSRWLCFDADDDRGFQGLGSMAATLTRTYTIILERSRRGGHLWLLFKPTPWTTVVQWGHDLALHYGLQQIERYPLTGDLRGVKAPLTRHPKSAEVYPLIDLMTGAIIDDPLNYLMTLTRQVSPPVALTETGQPREILSRDIYEYPGELTRPHDLQREISKYTALHYKGRGKWVGLCCLHDDRYPSLGVVEGYWKCFREPSCGSGGLNAFRARMREKGLLRD